ITIFFTFLIYILVFRLRSHLIKCKDAQGTRNVKSLVWVLPSRSLILFSCFHPLHFVLTKHYIKASTHSICITNFPAGCVSERAVKNHFVELFKTNTKLTTLVRWREKRREQKKQKHG